MTSLPKTVGELISEKLVKLYTHFDRIGDRGGACSPSHPFPFDALDQTDKFIKFQGHRVPVTPKFQSVLSWYFA